jgi:hypothetical protein
MLMVALQITLMLIAIFLPLSTARGEKKVYTTLTMTRPKRRMLLMRMANLNALMLTKKSLGSKTKKFAIRSFIWCNQFNPCNSKLRVVLLG